MYFVFNYKPQAKMRPRFGFKGKVYNPQSKLARVYKWEAASQMRSQSSERPLESPISFGMRVYVPMPKTWSKKRKKEQINNPVTSTPDLDNFFKWYADILNGIAYSDDKLIAQAWCEKIWATEAKVEIYIHKFEMSYIDEVAILGSTAVKIHETLDSLYHWAHNLKKLHPRNKIVLSCANEVINQCLDGGLDEIYGE